MDGGRTNLVVVRSQISMRLEPKSGPLTYVAAFILKKQKTIVDYSTVVFVSILRFPAEPLSVLEDAVALVGPVARPIDGDWMGPRARFSPKMLVPWTLIGATL